MVGLWTVTNDKDIATDKPFPKAWVYSTGGDLFRIFCFTGRGPAVNLASIHAEYQKGEIPALIWRVDDKPATAALVKAFDPHQIVIALSRLTYQALSMASRMRVRIVRTNGLMLDMDFPLSRTKEAFRDMLIACPLDSAPEKPPHFYDPSQDLFGQLPKPIPTPAPNASQ